MILRKYGVAATIDGIPLITRDAMDYLTSPSLVAGDVVISKDGGANANIATLPTVTPAAGTSLRVALSATEMQAARIVVRFVDQTNPKAWEDQEIIIETFGHASAQFAVDLSTTYVTAGAGGVSRKIILEDESGNAIVGAGVWLTNDEAGTDVVRGTLTTDDAGEVTVMVDLGATYYVWTDSTDANFTNPTEWTVT